MPRPNRLTFLIVNMLVLATCGFVLIKEFTQWIAIYRSSILIFNPKPLAYLITGWLCLVIFIVASILHLLNVKIAFFVYMAACIFMVTFKVLARIIYTDAMTDLVVEFWVPVLLSTSLFYLFARTSELPFTSFQKLTLVGVVIVSILTFLALIFFTVRLSNPVNKTDAFSDYKLDNDERLSGDSVLYRNIGNGKLIIFVIRSICRDEPHTDITHKITTNDSCTRIFLANADSPYLSIRNGKSDLLYRYVSGEIVEQFKTVNLIDWRWTVLVKEGIFVRDKDTVRLSDLMSWHKYRTAEEPVKPLANDSLRILLEN